MSIGMLVERRTGYNIFYELEPRNPRADRQRRTVADEIHPVFGTDGRVTVVGPTQHGLAATTMLVVVMPFVLVRVFDATTRQVLVANAGAFALMVAGAMATDRKTALLVPIAVVIYIACYRPRQVLRLAPLGLVVRRSSCTLPPRERSGTVLNINSAATSSSTTHRVGDFTDIAPDVLAHPVLGRGFGTVNPGKAISVSDQRQRVHRRGLAGRRRWAAGLRLDDPRPGGDRPCCDPLARADDQPRSSSPLRVDAWPFSSSAHCLMRCPSQRRRTCFSWLQR